MTTDAKVGEMGWKVRNIGLEALLTLFWRLYLNLNHSGKRWLIFGESTSGCPFELFGFVCSAFCFDSDSDLKAWLERLE